MSAEVGTELTPEVPHLMSPGARLVGVFFSPGATFADIARWPEWFYPLLALLISSLGFTETMLTKIGMQRIIRISLEQSGQATRMNAEQIEKAVEGGAKIGAIFAHLGGLLGWPLIVLLIAGLGLVMVNGVFGAAINFKTAFSVSCYANLPRVLEAFMGIAMILSGEPDRFNPQSPAPSNPGFFLDPQGVSKPLYSLASSVDVFSIWIITLLGIGMSEATGRKVKALSIFLTYVGIWMVWVSGKVGLAALMG